MRDIYATTMHLVDVAGGDAFAEACERAVSWAWRIDDPRPDLEAQPSGRLPEGAGAEETSVEWWSVTEGTARALEIKLRHLDSQDNTLQWLTTVTVSDIEGSTRATVRLERGARVHMLQPWRMDLRAPGIVVDLMRPPLLAYAGTLELSPGPRMLERRHASDFVEDLLMAEGRALPILVASASVWPGFVDALAKALAGLVQVVRLADSAAEEALDGALRRSGFTVPSGGLRLYWPGFGSEGQPRHPYWTPAQIARGRQGGPSVLKQLINMLAPISTGRVPADPGVMRARREWLLAGMRQQRERQEAQRERARRERHKAAEVLARARAEQTDGEEVERLNAELAELSQELAVVEEERDGAMKQAEEAAAAELKVIEESLEVDARAATLGERVAKLEAENAGLRRSVKTLSIHKADIGDEAEAADVVPEELSTWEEVAEHLPSLAGPGFALTDEALGCMPRYPHPHKMWRALRALERVGRDYNELGAELGMRFEDFAIERGGIEVALQDSTYEEACFFQYEHVEYSRLPHVKVDDAKAPNEVGRIYFALDPDHNRLIVDWFGTKPDRPMTPRVAAA